MQLEQTHCHNVLLQLILLIVKFKNKLAANLQNETHENPQPLKRKTKNTIGVRQWAGQDNDISTDKLLHSVIVFHVLYNLTYVNNSIVMAWLVSV